MLTVPQIQAQLESVLGRDAKARIVAMRAEQKLSWPEAINRGGRRFRLRWCESTLALREALADDLSDGENPQDGLVLLTPLATFDLPDDVAARVAKARVLQPEGWAMVRELFAAKELDARLGRYSWMPQLLIDLAREGYEPVPNGFLDLETAWRAVLARLLGLPAARPDAQALLTWTLMPESTAALNGIPPAARPDVMAWLAQAAGSVGRMVVACMEAGRAADAVPLGLICDVVFSPEGEGQADLGRAATRLESYVGNQDVTLQDGRAWALAATRVLAGDDLPSLAGVVDRAQALLRDIRIEAHAALSAWLPVGLEARLGDLARALDGLLDEPGMAAMDAVEAATDRVLGHRALASHPQRADLVRMARRLARWLSAPAPAPRTVPEVALWQADEGAFVDWSRFRLLGGDESPALSAALVRLREAAMARREAIARRFADALPAWVAQGGPWPSRLLPVEDVLARVVAPLAGQHPVLVLVVDGLSTGIFRELFHRPQRHGWAEWVPEAGHQPLAALAAIPTVTEVSRTTLLCGRRTLGAAPQEKAGFAGHGDLLARSDASAPPKLFHKGELAADGHLAPEVRNAIANPKQRIVGVVYNAVDDHLSGPDQLHQRWQLDDLRLMLPLLREARDARRIVIITADHGHVLEDGSRALRGGESDRWRDPGAPTTADELELQGPRVLHPAGGHRVVCLWNERSRYASRRTGYHGGVAPQELVVPLSLLVPIGVHLDGWMPAPPLQPDWWESARLASPAALSTATSPTVAPAAAVPSAGKPSKRRSVSVPAAQAGLFSQDEVPLPDAQPATGADAAPTAQDWVTTLMASPVYASQRQLAARVAPPDAQLRALLQALDERGGKLARTALAQRLAVAEMRLGGLLSGARRVLNVDQAEILVSNDSDQTVTLNRALLLRQFGLPPMGSR